MARKIATALTLLLSIASYLAVRSMAAAMAAQLHDVQVRNGDLTYVAQPSAVVIATCLTLITALVALAATIAAWRTA